MKKNENLAGDTPVKEKRKNVSAAEGLHRRERKKKEVSAPSKKPKFAERKKLFKKRSFRRQYALFREGGLGVIDSFFNAFYITLTEKSIEREKRRLEEKGDERSASPHHFLDHHSPLLRALSFCPARWELWLFASFLFGREMAERELIALNLHF